MPFIYGIAAAIAELWTAFITVVLPLLWDGLAWLMGTRIGFFIASAMVWLGINFASTKIILQPTIDLVSGLTTSGSLGSTAVAAAAWQWLLVLHFDKAVSMVSSAYVTKWGTAQVSLHLAKRISS